MLRVRHVWASTLSNEGHHHAGQQDFSCQMDWRPKGFRSERRRADIHIRIQALRAKPMHSMAHIAQDTGQHISRIKGATFGDRADGRIIRWRAQKLIPGTKQKGIGNKTIVFGMHEHDGRVIMKHVTSKKANILRPLIDNNIAKGSIIHHDNNSTYGDLKARGFIPKLVPKKGGKGFNGRRGINNNSIEGDWAALKNNLFKYRGVSDRYLQSYLDEFCFRRRNRGTWIKDNPMLALFRIVLGRYLSPSVFL